MNREIKFRAWSPRVTKQGDKFIGAFTDVYAVLEDRKLVSSDFVPNYIVFQQYTGLLDKNGKEIYEGDILRPMKGIEAPDVTQLADNIIVKWDINSFTVPRISWVWEVVGNIYENPELLS